MEIEITPVTYEKRLAILEAFPEMPQKGYSKFPWVIVIITFLAGGIVGAVIYNQIRRKKKEGNGVE